MTNYQTVRFPLSKNQRQKLIKAKKNGEAVTITLKGTFDEGDELLLTQQQINKLQKAAGKGVRITFSKTQISEQTGGFLSAIMPFLTKTVLPALGTLGLSAASGAISGATQRATKGSGLRRRRLEKWNRWGEGLYQSGDGIFPVMFKKNDMKKVLNTISTFENAGLIEKGSLEGAMNGIKEQKGGFLGTLLATLAGSIIPALFPKN